MTAPAIRSLALEVRNDLGALGGTLDAVDAFLQTLGIHADAVAEVMVIVDELASNVAKYAWPDGGEHSFALRLRAVPEDGAHSSLRLTIELEDDGIAFDPAAAPVPDLDSSLDDRKEGGLGWMLVRAMSDEFAHRRIGGRNHLTVGKSAQLA